MINLGKRTYPYAEEINEGVLAQLAHQRPGRVLDVGCGRAALGEALRARGWDVWGVGSDEGAAATARTRLQRVIARDLLDVEGVAADIGDTRFDALVFSDVLEHLYDPHAVLTAYLPFVRPGGRVVVSVPNAVVFTNRFKWMCGRVEYEDTGVMDRTHIRFFTVATIRALVEATGCHIEKVDSTPNLVRAFLPLVKRVLGGKGDNPRALLDSPLYKAYMRLVYPIERGVCNLWKSMLAFRIVVTARVPELEDPTRPPLTVAMITMNEERAVEKVIADIQRVAPLAEVLLVDSSRDRTPDLAEAMGARVVRQFPPKGYGPAMDLVLRSARGRVVVTLDCDDTYPPEMIPVLAQMLEEEGFDVVDGVRTWRKPAAMPWLNYLANVGFALVASAAFGRLVLDLHSGMRAYRRGMIDELRYDPKGAALPVELLLRPMRMGRRGKTVNIDYRPRIGESTMRPLESAAWTLKRIWRARFR